VAAALVLAGLMGSAVALTAGPAARPAPAPVETLVGLSRPLTTTTPSATPSATATEEAIPTATAEPPTATRTALPGPTATFTATPCGPSPTPAPRFAVEVQVGGNVARGRTTPGGAVSAALHDPSGALVATRQGAADPDGGWALELVTAQGGVTVPVAIRPDWLVRVSAPNGAAEVRPMGLSVLMDPPHRQITGQGPPNRALALRTSFTGGEIPVQTDAQGRFASPWPFSRELAGGEWAEVVARVDATTAVFARDRIAALVVELDSPVIRMVAPPLAHVAFSVERWTGPVRDILAAAAATTNGWGEVAFVARNQQAGNALLPLTPGLTVLATSNTAGFSHRVTVEALSGAIVPGGEAISGRGPANHAILARLRWPEDPPGWCLPREVERRGYADGAGAFTIPLTRTPYSDPLPRPVEELAAVVLFYRTPALDEVHRPIPPSFGQLADTLYLPAAQRQHPTRR
jgi:hypothetical protein